MFSAKESVNSPKVLIDFPQLLFEISGNSKLEQAELFYDKIISYVYDNFYQIKDSIYQRDRPSITLHFYMREMGQKDREMFLKIDNLFNQIQEFTTYNYWYYNDNSPQSTEQANFLNFTRLIATTRGV